MLLLLCAAALLHAAPSAMKMMVKKRITCLLAFTQMVISSLAHIQPGLSNVCARKLPYSDRIKAVVAIPDFEVSTENARQALPPTYSRKDVVVYCESIRVSFAEENEDSFSSGGYLNNRCLIFSEWGFLPQHSAMMESLKSPLFTRP